MTLIAMFKVERAKMISQAGLPFYLFIDLVGL